MKDKKEVKEALVEYQTTSDILRLQQRIGHKNVRSTFAFLERSKLFGETTKKFGD
jgi:hypothetical protein